MNITFVGDDELLKVKSFIKLFLSDNNGICPLSQANFKLTSLNLNKPFPSVFIKQPILLFAIKVLLSNLILFIYHSQSLLYHSKEP